MLAADQGTGSGSSNASRPGSSFYGSLFPKTRTALPPIFTAAGGRSEGAKAVDSRIRAAGSMSELLEILREALSQFDEGSLVIAFCTGAKLAEDRSPHLREPVWDALQERLRQVASNLEPRGLSMLAYASAKLAWREEAFLSEIATASTKKAAQFGPTDIAKISWAFTKLDFVQQVPDFWVAMEAVVQRKVQDARYVDLSMIAWAFGMAERGSPAMCAEIASTALRLMQELTPQCLANIALIFARLNIKNSELFDAISRRALAQVPDFADFDVTSLCWAMARADAVDFELFDKLASHTVACHFVKRYSTEMAAQMVWAFAVARLAHSALFAELSDFIARHASVFEAQYVANCSWALAVLDVRDSLAWQALAFECKGGRLWRYRPDELCAVCWAFAKIRWDDDELIGDMVQVASQRILEFDTQCLVNMLSALVVLCDQQGCFDATQSDDPVQSNDPDAAFTASSFDHKEDLKLLLDSVLSQLLSQEKALQPEEMAVAVRLVCSARRLPDACRLCCNGLPGAGAWSALLAAAERTDASLATQLWGRLAEALPSPLSAAARRCSLTRQGSCAQAATSLPTSLQPEATDESLGRLAQLLHLAESGTSAQPGLAAGQVALMAELAAFPQFALDIRGGEDALALAMAVRCPVWCFEGSAPAAAALRSCAAAWAPNLEVHLGPAEDLMEKVLQRRGAACVDLLVLHGGGEAQLNDLRRAEDLGLLSPGCHLLCVDVLLPGAPSLLWQLHAHPGYDLEILEVPQPGVSEREGWIASCRCRAAGRSPEVSELPALRAASERLWRESARGTASPAAGQFATRFRRFLESHGLRPSRSLSVAASSGLPEPSVQLPVPKDIPAQPLNLRELSFTDWLASMDPSGDLLRYLPAAQDCYDTVAQIAQTYAVLDKDSNRKVLDPLLYEDFGIAEADRPVFTRWFVDICGVQDPT